MSMLGTFTPPGGPSPIPTPTPEDVARNTVADYQAAGPVAQAYIRRAVHWEHFARALEEELEKLRAEKRGAP